MSLLLVFFLLLASIPLPTWAVTVTWQDMSDNEDGFRTQRQVNGGSFVSVPTCDVGTNVQTCQDANVVAGTNYCYKVLAYNTAGESAYSNTACLTVVATNAGMSQVACLYAPDAPPPSDLVLALNFNAGSGTVAADTSGQNNHGTLAGATWTASGKYGGALSFDGVNDWVTVNDANSLDLTTGMTIEAWVFPTITTGVRDILIKQGSGVDIYNLYARNWQGRPESNVFVGGSNRVAEGTVLAANIWTHVAGTYNGSTLRLFINGVQIASTAVSGPIATSTGPLRIGGNSLWNNEFYQGRIDEVRIYNRALTAAEIITDKDTPIP